MKTDISKLCYISITRCSSMYVCHLSVYLILYVCVSWLVSPLFFYYSLCSSIQVTEVNNSNNNRFISKIIFMLSIAISRPEFVFG